MVCPRRQERGGIGRGKIGRTVGTAVECAIGTLFGGQTIPGRGQACTWRIYADVSQAGICSLSRRQARRRKPDLSPEMSRQEPGEFTRMFVRATASMPQRPMPAVSDPAAFAPPATPRLKGFSTPGVSDSASAEGSFTQLFQSPAPAAGAAAGSAVHPFKQRDRGGVVLEPGFTPEQRCDGVSRGYSVVSSALARERTPSQSLRGTEPAAGGAACERARKHYHVDPKVNRGSAISPQLLRHLPPLGLSRRGCRSRGNLPASCRGPRRAAAAGQGAPAEKVAAPAAGGLSLSRRSHCRRPRLSPHQRFLRSRFPSLRLLQYQRLRLRRAQLHLRANSSR